MSYLVEMMDGTIIDLDCVIGISNIDAIGNSSNGKLETITRVIFNLVLTGPTVNKSFNNSNLNIIYIGLEKVEHHLWMGFNKEKETKEKYLEFYKLGLGYKRYLDFVELFKKHKNCKTIIKV